MNPDLKNTAALVIFRGVRTLVVLSCTVLLGRIVGPVVLGEYAMLLAAGTLLHSILLNWSHSAHVRFGREEWVHEGALTATWAARWPLLVSGTTIAVVLVLFDPFGWLDRVYNLEGGLRFAALLPFAALWLAFETQSMLQAEGALGRLAVIPIIIDGTAVVLLCVALVWRQSVPAYGVIAGLLSWTTIGWAMLLLLERKHACVRWTVPDWSRTRELVAYAWPLVPGFLLGYVSDWGDQILLGYFRSNREVGLFQVAYQCMTVMIGFAAPVGIVLLTRLIEKSVSESDIGRKYIASVAPTVMVLWALAVVPVVSIAPLLFPILMGAEFAGTGDVVAILLASIPAVIVTSTYGALFGFQKRLWRSSLLYGGLMSALNVAISLSLMPRFGALGAAIATSVSYLFVQMCYLVDQHMFYKVGLRRIGVIFFLLALFGLLQAILRAPVARAGLCLLTLLAIVIVSRRLALLEPAYVRNIFRDRLQGLGTVLLRVGGAIETR